MLKLLIQSHLLQSDISSLNLFPESVCLSSADGSILVVLTIQGADETTSENLKHEDRLFFPSNSYAAEPFLRKVPLLVKERHFKMRLMYVIRCAESGLSQTT